MDCHKIWMVSGLLSLSAAFANLSEQFPEGLPVSIGSGLYFITEEDGELEFITIAERQSIEHQQNRVDINFAPLLFDVKVTKDGIKAINPRALYDKNMRIGELPVPDNLIGSVQEIPLRDTLVILGNVIDSLDIEQTVLAEGLWVSDIHGPLIVHLDESGDVLSDGNETGLSNNQGAIAVKKIVPWRQQYRGFEHIARLPDNTVIAPMKSTLDVHNRTANTAQLIRIVSFEPISQTIKMFGYPIATDEYLSPKNITLGEIVALDQNRLLIVEQGPRLDGRLWSRLYIIHLADATDLVQTDQVGLVELDDAKTLKERNVVLLKKELLLDLTEHGWIQDRVEGLLLKDEQSIIIANSGNVMRQQKNLDQHQDKFKDGITFERLNFDDSGDFWRIKFPEKI